MSTPQLSVFVTASAGAVLALMGTDVQGALVEHEQLADSDPIVQPAVRLRTLRGRWMISRGPEQLQTRS